MNAAFIRCAAPFDHMEIHVIGYFPICLTRQIYYTARETFVYTLCKSASAPRLHNPVLVRGDAWQLWSN